MNYVTEVYSKKSYPLCEALVIDPIDATYPEHLRPSPSPLQCLIAEDVLEEINTIKESLKSLKNLGVEPEFSGLHISVSPLQFHALAAIWSLDPSEGVLEFEFEEMQMIVNKC